MKFKKILLFLFITVVGFCGVISANALTISDDGKYTLILTSSDGDVSIDGASEKVIRFNVNEDETTVKLSELTQKIVPFNGKNEFAYWGSFIGEKESEDIAITEFSWSGEVVGGTYTNGLTLYAIFSDKPLQGTGTYYITLDGFAGTINGEKIVKLTSKSTEFKTVDLTKYTPVRKGYTFTGWELDGKFVTSIDSSYFANRDCITLTATYTQDTFSGEGIVLKLNANGGKLNGKEINSYDYIGGENSGTTMSLLPYIPVKEGYTFNGWNTKKDGSGEILKYVYWRFWDKENETDVEKDTLIKDDNGYERYKNVTLYASWTANNDTVKEIKSTGLIKAIVNFDKGIDKNYTLDIKEIEIVKQLKEKNVKFLVDINILDGNNVVSISNTKMKIRVAIPNDLKGFNKYEVVYIKDGLIKETLPATLDNGYIIFETTHLSHYGILASTSNPNTGDNIMYYVVTSVLVTICLTSMFVYKKRSDF
ncbi:MAG TPA: InlB B-repeat-containing protein [Bacilli bacterium]|nr:InlB B-repeat-containing protein [Bacilli bacterium]